jgi:hypothetical protein
MEDEVTQTVEEKNKAFVLEALETLFNKRDYVSAECFWSPNYIQHSAHIPPGREGLFALVKGTPDSLHYENGLTVANGDYVLLHGRFSGIGQTIELGRGGYRAAREWPTGGALGLRRGRGDEGNICQQPAYVRGQVSHLISIFGTRGQSPLPAKHRPCADAAHRAVRRQ